MELGILERIESKLDTLIGKKSTPPTEAPKLALVPEEPIVTQEVQQEPEKKGSGLIDDGGYEWDERIHSSKKTKTKDGLWKKVRGCDKDLYDRIMAEQTIQSGGVDKNSIDVPTPAAPSVPAAPATVPTPTVADPFEEDKKKAMSSIAELTTSYGIPFDDVLAQLPDGVTNFDSLPKEQYKDFALKTKTWVDWLGMIQEEDVKIQTMGAQQGIEGILVIYGHYNKATNANQISPENLPTVHQSLEEYRKQWDAIQ